MKIMKKLKMRIKKVDLYIIRVKKNIYSRIDTALCCTIMENGNLSRSEEYSRDEIINLLLARKKIRTLYEDNHQWVDGEKVILYSMNNENYIKTSANETKEDSFGGLPLY